MRPLDVCAGLALLVATGCGSRAPLPAEGSITLYVDTDAPVPPPAGQPLDPNAQAPLFDRLHVDVYPAGATDPCGPCSREFDVDQGLFHAGASLSIIPTGQPDGIVARVRLFRSASVIQNDIAEDSTIDTWVALPTAPSEGAVEATAFLATQTVGVATGSLTAPVQATPGAPSGSQVGTWPYAQRFPCTRTPGPHEVCIPGGAFWMGNARSSEAPPNASDRERLVVLSPFFIDDHELTLAEFRASGIDPTNRVAAWTGQTAGTDYNDWCVFSFATGPYESSPMNCITWQGARDVCNARGADLPTEAEFEYVAGALSSQLYTWGQDLPQCDDVVWGRGGAGLEKQSPSACLALAQTKESSPIGGALPLPSNPSDPASLEAVSRNRARLDLPTGSIWDLSGNAAEWTFDEFQEEDEPCWSNPTSNVFVEPVCNQPSKEFVSPDPTKTVRVTRGGSWLDDLEWITAAYRGAQLAENPHEEVGFRCVRPAG